MKHKDKIVNDFVIQILTNAGLSGDKMTKQLIIWGTFYKEIKPAIKKLSSKDIIFLASKFLIFLIQFETIVIRSCKPLSDSGNVAKDIISMYSSKDLLLSDEHKLIHNPKER